MWLVYKIEFFAVVEMVRWSTQLNTAAGIKTTFELQPNVFRADGPLWNVLTPDIKLRVLTVVPSAMSISHCMELCLLRLMGVLSFSIRDSKMPILGMLAAHEKYAVLSRILGRNISLHVQLAEILYRLPVNHAYRCLRTILVSSGRTMVDLWFRDNKYNFARAYYLDAICSSPELSKLCLSTYILVNVGYIPTRKMQRQYVTYGKKMLSHIGVLTEFRKLLCNDLFIDSVIIEPFSRDLLKWMMRELSWYTLLLIDIVNMEYEELDNCSIDNVYIRYFANLIDETIVNAALMNELRAVAISTQRMMGILGRAASEIDLHVDASGYVDKLKRLICEI